MLFKWVDHDRLTRLDQLKNIIFDMGIASIEQLEAVTNMTPSNLRKHIHKLKTSGKDMLRVYYMRSNKPGKSPAAYTLGVDSLKDVSRMRAMPENYVKVWSEALMSHQLGINDILVRAINHAKDNKMPIEWFGERVLTEFIYLDMLGIEPDPAKASRLIRPDGKLKLADKFEYFIEYDNDTESPRRVEEKFRRYIELYEKINYGLKILWVTPNVKRTENLKTNWELLKTNSVHVENMPEMFFSTIGEEMMYYPVLKKKTVV